MHSKKGEDKASIEILSDRQHRNILKRHPQCHVEARKNDGPVELVVQKTESQTIM